MCPARKRNVCHQHPRTAFWSGSLRTSSSRGVFFSRSPCSPAELHLRPTESNPSADHRTAGEERTTRKRPPVSRTERAFPQAFRHASAPRPHRVPEGQCRYIAFRSGPAPLILLRVA